jgi:predicted lipoprotein with Yx(FWY)xxD motif
MSLSRSAWLLVPAATAGVLTLAACGSSSGGSSSTGASAGGATPAMSSSSSAAGATAAAVKVRSTSLGMVLTDGRGRTLYVSDQEKGTVLCKSSACTSIWMPVTTTGSSAPTGPGGVTLGTTTRPDGTHQLTAKGQPLYTFSFDHAAGSTGGDGVKDSFDGTSFTWHAALTGAAAPQPSMSSSSSSSGYHY